MKFGKEFKSEMVPEWEAVYMDYNHLKTILKDVKRSLHSTPCPKRNKASSLYMTFHGLTNRHSSVEHPAKSDDEVIVVSSVIDDLPGAKTGYRTLLVSPSEEGGEQEVMFFGRLDDEFNKVNMFYKDKEDEAVAEANELSRQMNSLIDLRVKVERPHLVGVAMDHVQLDASPTFPQSNSIRSDLERMDVIKEVDTTREDGFRRAQKHDRKGGRIGPAPLNDHITINIDPESSPISTVKGILRTLSFESPSIKAELRKAEAQMTRAFLTFHHKLRLLKSYSFLNELAFSKIMTKYDKITLKDASKPFLKMVDDSYIGKSEEVNMLIEKVEATFIKHFAHGNREKAMKILKLKQKKERHSVTFLTGTFFGFALALIVAIIVTLHVRDLLEKSSSDRNNYMENIFPLYSFFGFLVLHLIMYSGNVYFWTRYRINYQFIFGLKQGTELRYREVLLVASGLSVLMFGGVLLNLNMEMDPRTGNYKIVTELLPLLLLTVVLVITFCPFNIMYRSSRFFLLKCMFHCICAPFYKVTLPDFFMGDQLTSQVQAFRTLEFYICYYGWGDFKKRTNTCNSNKVYQSFYVIVAVIPFWIRFLQCLRRYFGEKDKMQGYNALKYFSTIVAISLVTLFDLKRDSYWRIIATIISILSTIFVTYWDIVIDWGLLQRNSKNKWLRDKLIIQNKTVYYLVMVEDVILRLAWMQVIVGWRELPFLHRKAVVTLMGSLEIIRRGIWNFFRIENEHLNNVGKYRAFKSVPLPFQADEEDKSI